MFYIIMKNIIIEYCLCIFHHENEFICENDRCFHNLNNVKSDEYEIDLHKKKYISIIHI